MNVEPEFDPKTIDEFKTTLMQQKGVQAVGDSIVDGKPCLKVYFLDKASMNSMVIPDTIRVPVVKVISGSIRSQ